MAGGTSMSRPLGGGEVRSHRRATARRWPLARRRSAPSPPPARRRFGTDARGRVRVFGRVSAAAVRAGGDIAGRRPLSGPVGAEPDDGRARHVLVGEIGVARGGASRP